MWSPQFPCDIPHIQYNLAMHKKYDPNIHHRRSIRIPGYDYSQEGWYYITICTQDNTCIFGQLTNDNIRLNSGGRMVETWWRKIPAKFQSIQTDQYIVMPNHFHGIININARATPCDPPTPVEAAPRGRLDPNVESPLTHNKSGQSRRIAPTLGDIVRWFKTMTSNQYIKGVKQNAWPPFPGRLWQRNYYEHIIRNEEELNQIRQYIADNPRRPEPT